MAQVTGKLISTSKITNQDGSHNSWTPEGKNPLYSWELIVEVDGVEKKGKALSTKNDNYIIANGVEITFETNWEEKYGHVLFKGVKDLAKANEFSKKGGGSKFNKEQYIKETSIEVTIKYLEALSNFKDIKVNYSTVEKLATTVVEKWIREHESNLFVAKSALFSAVSSVSLNLIIGDDMINDKEGFIERANTIYKYITS